MTAYKFTEVNFVVDGEFELKEGQNRKVIFNNKDTTVYRVEFNKIK